MTQFVVHDGYRTITFEGDLLGQASSKRPGVWRWTDLYLYRTTAGTYILQKIGASRVTHVPTCPRIEKGLPRFQEVYPGEDPDSDDFQYHDCVPQYYDFPGLLVERDRPWAQITDEPYAVVKALMRYRGESRWLPRTSTQLLDQAADIDPKIREAYTGTESFIA